MTELCRINQLLLDGDFILEFDIFKRTYQRLKVRLRNNKLIGELKQYKNLITKLRTDYPAALFIRYQRQEENKKVKLATLRCIYNFVLAIDSILDKNLSIYATIQPHYRVGHLLQHYIVLKASLARLAFCFKALLVYSADSFYAISSIKEKIKKNLHSKPSVSRYKEIREVLAKHNCQSKQDIDTNESPEVVLEVHKIEEIGQIIDRASLRPKRACKRS